jgi:hypothetical protein
MRRAIANGAALMILFRLCDRSIGLVSTAILARLLLPADFGLVTVYWFENGFGRKYVSAANSGLLSARQRVRKDILGIPDQRDR